MKEIVWFTLPLQTLLYIVCVNVLRDSFSSLVLSRVRLARGEMGSPQAAKVLLSTWILPLVRHEFSFRKDVFWVSILSLQTVALSMLPVSRASVLEVDRPALAFVLLLLVASLAWIICIWKIEGEAPQIDILRQIQRSMFGTVASLIVVEGVLLSDGGGGLSGFSRSPHIAFGSPAAFSIFLLCFFLAPSMQLSVPRGRGGWGLERLVGNLSEILWYTLLVCLFLGSVGGTPEAVFIETVWKTSLVLIIADVARVFLSAVSFGLTQKVAALVLLPLLVLSILHVFWKGIVL